jgi:hypothetical protein
MTSKNNESVVFKNNIQQILNNFKPGEVISSLTNRPHTRSLNNVESCRITGAYIYHSLTNNKKYFNQPKDCSKELFNFIHWTQSGWNQIKMFNDNKCIKLITLEYNWGHFWSPLHLFCVVNVDGEYKLLQSWKTDLITKNVNGMSLDWMKQDWYLDYVNELVNKRDKASWVALFGEDTFASVSNDGENIDYKFRLKFIVDEIDQSWFE